EPGHVDDLLHPVEVAEGVPDSGQGREGRVARGLVALFDRQVPTKHAREVRLPVPDRYGPREVEQALHGEVRDGVRARRVTPVEGSRRTATATWRSCPMCSPAPWSTRTVSEQARSSGLVTSSE